MTTISYTTERTAQYLAAMAVVSRVLEDRDPVAISLTPRCGFGGFVKFGDDVAPVMTTSQMRHRIVVSLAGVAAEDALGERTTGCSQALSTAQSLARRLGQVELVDRPDAFVLGTIDFGMERARALVAENRTSIDALAAILVEKGSVDGEDLQQFMAARVAAGNAAESRDIPRFCS